jgi:hypothetical protein
VACPAANVNRRKAIVEKKISKVVIKISVSDSDQDQIQIQSGQWIRIRIQNLPRVAEDHRLNNSSHVKQYTYVTVPVHVQNGTLT